MKSNTIVLLTNAAMTGTSTVVSAPIPLDQIFGYAVQAVWTGTPNGTLILQASCDVPATQPQTSNGGPYSITNWTPIDGASTTIAGSSGNFMFNVDGAYYRWVQLSYTNTSSTGSLSALMFVKGI